MNLNPSDIALHLVNILVLYALLRLLIYKPVRKFMDARAARVQAQLDEAEHIGAKAREDQAEYARRLAAVDEEAHDKLIASNRAAGEAAEVIAAEAHAEAQKILDKAQEEAEAQRRDIQRQVRPQISGMAVEIAEKLLGREVSAEDNRAIIDSFFESLEKVG